MALIKKKTTTLRVLIFWSEDERTILIQCTRRNREDDNYTYLITTIDLPQFNRSQQHI